MDHHLIASFIEADHDAGAMARAGHEIMDEAGAKFLGARETMLPGEIAMNWGVEATKSRAATRDLREAGFKVKVQMMQLEEIG